MNNFMCPSFRSESAEFWSSKLHADPDSYSEFQNHIAELVFNLKHGTDMFQLPKQSCLGNILDQLPEPTGPNEQTMVNVF